MLFTLLYLGSKVYSTSDNFSELSHAELCLRFWLYLSSLYTDRASSRELNSIDSSYFLLHRASSNFYYRFESAWLPCFTCILSLSTSTLFTLAALLMLSIAKAWLLLCRSHYTRGIWIDRSSLFESSFRWLCTYTGSSSESSLKHAAIYSSPNSSLISPSMPCFWRYSLSSVGVDSTSLTRHFGTMLPLSLSNS